MKRVRAFTLVEILVATGVAMLVMGGALALAGQALAWEGRSRVVQQARSEAARVLEQMEMDLQSIRRGDGDGVGLAATFGDGLDRSGLWESPAAGPPPQTISVSGDAITAMRFGTGGVWLRFFATIAGPSPDEDGSEAHPRAVSYQIIRRRIDRETAPGYWLHRTLVRPGAEAGRPGAWESGWDLDPAAAGYYARSGPNNDGTVTGDPFGIVSPGSAADPWMRNVVDLGVRFLARDQTGHWQVVFPVSATEREYLAPRMGRYPEAIELMVRVLTGEGAQRLQQLEQVQAGAWIEEWERVAASESVVEMRRIPGPGAER